MPVRPAPASPCCSRELAGHAWRRVVAAPARARRREAAAAKVEAAAWWPSHPRDGGSTASTSGREHAPAAGRGQHATTGAPRRRPHAPCPSACTPCTPSSTGASTALSLQEDLVLSQQRLGPSSSGCRTLPLHVDASAHLAQATRVVAAQLHPMQHSGHSREAMGSSSSSSSVYPACEPLPSSLTLGIGSGHCASPLLHSSSSPSGLVEMMQAGGEGGLSVVLLGERSGSREGGGIRVHGGRGAGQRASEAVVWSAGGSRGLAFGNGTAGAVADASEDEADSPPEDEVWVGRWRWRATPVPPLPPAEGSSVDVAGECGLRPPSSSSSDGGGGNTGSSSGGDSPQNAGPASRKPPDWHSNPRIVTALLLRTQQLGRFERVLDQHAPFLIDRHVAIALGLLPRIADFSRKAGAVEGLARHPGSEAEERWLVIGGNGKGGHAASPLPPLPSLSWEDVAEAAAAAAGSASPVRCGAHAPAGMEHTLRSRQRRVRIRSLAARLAQGFQRFLAERSYGPLDLAIAVWALARVSYTPSAAWMSAVLAASLRCLPQFEPQQLLCLLWGVAVLGLDPGSTWLAAVQQHVLAAARAGVLPAPALAVSLWSLARIATRFGVEGSLGEPDGREDGLRQRQGRHNGLSQADSHDPDLALDEAGDWVHAAATAAGGEDPAGSSNSSSSSSSTTSSNGSVAHDGDSSESNGSRSSSSGDGDGGASAVSPAWVDAYLAATHPHLPSFELRHLCMTLFALARLGHRAPSAFVTTLLHQALALPDLLPGSAASLLWSLVHLRYRPPRGWLDAFALRVEDLLESMSPKELSMTVWALASLHAEPREALLLRFERASMVRLEECSPQGLALMMWALARLGFRPCIAWMDRLAQVSQDQMPQFSPQAQSMLVWSMAALKYSPNPAWLRAFAKGSAPGLSTRSPQTLALMLVALAKLTSARGPTFKASKLLGSTWVPTFLDVSGRLLRRQRAVAAAVYAEALQEARQRQHQQQQQQQQSHQRQSQQQQDPQQQHQHQQQPGQQQAQQQQQRLLSDGGLDATMALPSSEQRQHSQHVQPAQHSPDDAPAAVPPDTGDSQTRSSSSGGGGSSSSSASGSSVAAARRAAAAAAATLAAADAASSPGFSPAELSGVAWSLARLRTCPGPSWLTSFEAVALVLLPRMSARQASTVLFALALLPREAGRRPGEELVRRTVEHVAALLVQEQTDPPCVNSHDVCTTLWALAKLRFEPDEPALDALLAAAERLLPSSSHVDQALLLWALSRHHAWRLPPELVSKAVAASAPLLAPGSSASGEVSYLSLLTLVASLARLDHVYRPPQVWVEAAAAATARAATSPRFLALPAVQRSRMAEWAMFALDKLGHTGIGLEGQHMWHQQLMGGTGDAGEQGG